MTRILKFVSVRAAIAIVITLLLAGLSGIKALEAVRGPLAPGWVEDVTRPSADLVATQFDLDVALNRLQTLPTSPCWPCRARAALTRDAMSAPALRVLAMYADRDGQAEQANRLIDLASRLSRRESVVQYWKIEQASRLGDAKASVRHYDQAIAVRPQLGEVLFPQITARLDEPEFRAAFAELIRDGRHWIDEYMLAATSDPGNYRALAATLAVASPSGPVSDDLAPYERGLISALASNGDYAAAERLARRLLPSGDILADASFNERTFDSEYSPLLWTISENTQLASGLSDEGALRVEALSGASGIAIYRVFRLEPGRYRFSTRMRPIEGATLPSSNWQAHCLSGAGEGALERAESGPATDLDFTVPANCRAVRLSLAVSNTVGADLSAFELSAASLRRLES